MGAYIINIPDSVDKIVYTNVDPMNGKTYIASYSVNDLTPYTEPHTAYWNEYERGYEQGRKDGKIEGLAEARIYVKKKVAEILQKMGENNG